MSARNPTERRSGVYEDLSNVEFETSEEVEVIEKFNNMGLREELMRGIFAYGKEQISPVLVFLSLLYVYL